MTTKITGVDILIFVNAGTAELPEWTAVGGQKDATLTRTAKTIETTNKLSGGVDEFEYGNLNWTISCGGTYLEPEEGYSALVAAQTAKEKILARWQEKGEDVYEGLCLVTSIELSGSDGDPANYSIELQGSGPINDSPTQGGV